MQIYFQDLLGSRRKINDYFETTITGDQAASVVQYKWMKGNHCIN